LARRLRPHLVRIGLITVGVGLLLFGVAEIASLPTPP